MRQSETGAKRDDQRKKSMKENKMTGTKKNERDRASTANRIKKTEEETKSNGMEEQ